MKKLCFLPLILTASFIAADEASKPAIEPIVLPNVIDMAKKNTQWKVAIATGEEEQIVLMSVSKKTNPQNEIGTETHTFDQTILIVDGNGKAILNGKETPVKTGDMIFIPKGTPHNVLNLGEELKMISIYAETDIPAGSTFQTKADQIE